MTKPDFETIYTALRKRLTEIDCLAINTLIGAKIQDNELVIPFYGIPHRVSRCGVSDLAGRESNPAIAVVMCKYTLYFQNVIPEGSEELVTFREFEASGPLSGYFVENTQKLIAGAFAGNISALESRCKQLEGVLNADDNASYDLSVEFNALPRIPVFLHFNDRDEEFPAQCAILFRRSAGQFLDLQSLCICGTFLAGSLIGKSIVLPVPAAGAAPAESPSPQAVGAAEPLPVETLQAVILPAAAQPAGVLNSTGRSAGRFCLFQPSPARSLSRKPPPTTSP